MLIWDNLTIEQNHKSAISSTFMSNFWSIFQRSQNRRFVSQNIFSIKKIFNFSITTYYYLYQINTLLTFINSDTIQKYQETVQLVVIPFYFLCYHVSLHVQGLSNQYSRNQHLRLKALEIRYSLMDRYSVDIPWLSEAFGGNRI